MDCLYENIKILAWNYAGAPKVFSVSYSERATKAKIPYLLYVA